MEPRRIGMDGDASRNRSLCKPAIFAALFITMAVSFDEFAVAWFVSGLNETLPVKVLGFLQGQVSPRINVIGTFVFIASMTLVVLAQILLMKRSAAPRAAAILTGVELS